MKQQLARRPSAPRASSSPAKGAPPSLGGGSMEARRASLPSGGASSDAKAPALAPVPAALDGEDMVASVESLAKGSSLPSKGDTPPKDWPEPARPGLREGDDKEGVTWENVTGKPFVKGEGDEGDIAANDPKQGYLGDCYFVAGMVAVARANPEAIRKLIKENSDGTYTVTLYVREGWGPPKAKEIVVDGSFPMKGGRPRYTKEGDTAAEGKELWPMLLEKAWATHKGSYAGIEGGKVNDDGKFNGTIEVLTGKSETYKTTDGMSDSAVTELIRQCLEKKVSITCDSRNFEKEPKELKELADKCGVVGNHAYAPEAVDQSGKIDLTNPWGSSHVKALAVGDFKKLYRAVRYGG